MIATSRSPHRRLRFVALAAALALAATACGGGDGDVDDGAPRELVGVFGVDEGRCPDAGPQTGSFFRMVQPDGTLENGPFVSNADSPCADKTFTPLVPGSDGGLVTGDFQPQPDEAFDGAGNGTAERILLPTPFFAVTFAVATNPTDPQTGQGAPAPRLVAGEHEELSGDLSAFGVAWNSQHFNQGAPKPGDERPGLTVGPTGTYDPATGEYTLSWSSQIVGGPFNNFTGIWRLQGTFRPAAEGA